MRASRRLKWENKMHKLKRSIWLLDLRNVIHQALIMEIWYQISWLVKFQQLKDHGAPFANGSCQNEKYWLGMDDL